MSAVRVEVREGERYGFLVIEGEMPARRVSGSTKRYVRCRCDCGRDVEVRLSHLRSGHTISCGCFRPEGRIYSLLYHGLKDSPEYGIWKGMKKRCYKERSRGYRNYGGRGIRVCDRWLHSFKAFYEDMGPRPTPGHQIDRIDGNGDYEPGNCRWSTRREQNRNRVDNCFYDFDGKTLCLKDWADLYGMRKGTLHDRLARGMSFEEALTSPVRKWVRQDVNVRCVMREKHERACLQCGYETGVGCLVRMEGESA